MSNKNILCVCLGNICRSPLAEGVLRNELKKLNLYKEINVDSCGTSNYHVGQTPHHGGQLCAKSHGIDISKHKSRQIELDDFNNFDLILGMDRDNVNDINSLSNKVKNPKAKVALLSDFIPKDKKFPKDVPDCYYASSIF